MIVKRQTNIFLPSLLSSPKFFVRVRPSSPVLGSFNTLTCSTLLPTNIYKKIRIRLRIRLRKDSAAFYCRVVNFTLFPNIYNRYNFTSCVKIKQAKDILQFFVLPKSKPKGFKGLVATFHSSFQFIIFKLRHIALIQLSPLSGRGSLMSVCGFFAALTSKLFPH
jgi:hypothetical protein